jgi:hypothetical protein
LFLKSEFSVGFAGKKMIQCHLEWVNQNSDLFENLKSCHLCSRDDGLCSFPAAPLKSCVTLSKSHHIAWLWLLNSYTVLICAWVPTSTGYCKVKCVNIHGALRCGLTRGRCSLTVSGLIKKKNACVGKGDGKWELLSSVGRMQGDSYLSMCCIQTDWPEIPVLEICANEITVQCTELYHMDDCYSIV